MARSKQQFRGDGASAGGGRGLKSAQRLASRKLVDQYRRARISGDVDAAAEYLVEAWRRSPDDVGILALAATSLGEMGRSVQAITLLEEALKRLTATVEICDVIGKLAVDHLILPKHIYLRV